MARNRKGSATIGVDIGGTKTLYALFDEGFEVLAEEKLRTHAAKQPDRGFAKGMKQAVAAMLQAAKKKGLRVDCVGVGCAGDGPAVDP